MSHTYTWPYSPKDQAISFEPQLSGVILRIFSIPKKQAFWSNARDPGVPNLLINILTVQVFTHCSKSSYYNRDDRYTASAVPDLNLHFHFVVLKVVDLLCFFFCYPCIKRASYTDNEALHPSFPPFPTLQYQVYYIIIIIRKQDWTDEDSKWIYTA